MDFTTIGTLHSYARIKNLQFAAKHKLKTGQTIASASGRLNIGAIGAPRSNFLDQMMKTQKQKSDAASKKRLAAIKRKLMNGKRLSNEEMGFLLKNDSKLYRKAQKSQEARDELKAALNQAKSKEEARKAVLHAKMKASAECMAELDAAKAGGGSSGGGSGGYEASGEIGGVGGDFAGGGLIAGGGSAEGSAPSETSSDAATESAAASTPNAGSNSNADSAIDGAKNAQNNPTQNNPTSGVNRNQTQNGVNTPQSTNGASDADKDTPDDILEKYMMIIRALEDEWLQFSKSKQYRELPEAETDSANSPRKITVVNQKTLKMISAYRTAVSLSLAED